MKRTKPMDLAAERGRIFVFMLNWTEPSEGYVTVADLYKAYRKYVKGDWESCCTSVDSFGRLIPSHYERKVVNRKRDYKRCVMGIKLV